MRRRRRDRHQVPAQLAPGVVHRRGRLGPDAAPQLLLEHADPVLELEDPPDPGEADALVGELLDPAQQRDVALGVAPAAGPPSGAGSISPLRS